MPKVSFRGLVPRFYSAQPVLPTLSEQVFAFRPLFPIKKHQPSLLISQLEFSATGNKHELMAVMTEIAYSMSR